MTSGGCFSLEDGGAEVIINAQCSVLSYIINLLLTQSLTTHTVTQRDILSSLCFEGNAET